MFASQELPFVQAAAALAAANPFRPEEVSRLEDAAERVDLPTTGTPLSVPGRSRIGPLVPKAACLLQTVGERDRPPANAKQAALHSMLVRFVLYFRYRDQLQQSVDAGFADTETLMAPWFDDFRREFHQLSTSSDADDPLSDPAHVIACFFQIRRAYHLIQSQLIGASRPMQQLRAAAWESVFTADMEQYGRLLYDRMHDISTLVVGASGTGKELVARAVGLSRYIPFDPRQRRFAEPFTGAFHAVNLSALSPTLIEAELFGHARGAFTGAMDEREGWLETCREGHSVFLDEIGDVATALQVKLLRVLQERAFQRIGELRTRRFHGKVIAATNRDLAAEMSAGRFRPDLYYRLCSDVISTPSLHSQLSDRPDDLQTLVPVLVRRQVGREAPHVAERTCEYISRHLAEYTWPGNVRELEQCVRSVLLRGRYEPIATRAATARDRLARRLSRESPTWEQLLTEYCQVLYNETGAYAETARILELDRRTVQKRVAKAAAEDQR